MKRNKIIILCVVFTSIVVFLKTLLSAESVLRLKEEFQNDNPAVRKSVIIKLTKMNFNEDDEDVALEIIEKGMRDPDQWVKAESVDALRFFDNKKSFDMLKDILQKEEWRIKYIAFSVLRDIGDISFLEQTINSLNYDSNDSVKANCSALLGHIGDERAIPPLINVLERKDVVANNAWISLKGITGQNFGPNKDVWMNWWKKNKGSFNAVEFEISRLEQSIDSTEKIAAINRLWRLRAKRAISILKKKLKTEKENYIKQYIRKALDKLEDDIRVSP